MAQITEALKDLHNGGSPMSVTIARKLVSVFQSQPKKMLPPTFFLTGK